MRSLTVDFSNISEQKELRLDVNYRYFFDIKKASTWDIHNIISLSQVLEKIKSGKIKKGNLENEEFLVDLANIDRRYNNLSNVILVNEIGSDKNIINLGDIIIPKMQPRMGNIFTNEEHNSYLGSSELIEYKVNDSIFITQYLYYILTHPKFQNSLYYTESGKTHRRVSPDDLLMYKIPVIPISKQRKSLIKIQNINKQISDLRSQLKSITDLINDVYSNYFSINFTITDALNKELIYISQFKEIANEELKFDISLKYRKLFRQNIYSPSTFSWSSLNKLAFIKGGKRLPKGEDVVSENTGYKYIRVDDLDYYGHFDIENIKYISKEIHEKIKNYIAKEGDILLTIVGATVGKCGVLPKELDGENISENYARLIIKDSKKFESLYVLYTLMSKIGQYQINEYKGRGSQGKLAIFRIKKIQIPDISIDEQKNIINKIHSNVNEQKEILNKMESLRKKIDDIIESDIL